jgi:hypothetical protein
MICLRTKNVREQRTLSLQAYSDTKRLAMGGEMIGLSREIVLNKT